MKAQAIFRLASGLVAAMILSATADGAVTPHALFSDGAVLQQKVKVPVWGTTDQKEDVTVSIAGQTVSATPADGRWTAVLAPLDAGGPHVLVISQGQDKVEIKNVLVGEVWICGGQSNMQWTLKQSDGGSEAIATSANDKIRLITVPRKGSDKPETSIEAKWEIAGPSTTPEFSGVGYFFGRELQKQLSVPVGLIASNYGGTAAEQWMSKESIESHADRFLAAGMDVSLIAHVGGHDQ
jgi:sialate O-acetylesterase